MQGVECPVEGAPSAKFGAKRWRCPMGRTGNVIVLIVYLLTVPAGVFFYFTSPGMGYPKSTAGTIAGVLALVGLALVPVAIRNKPTDPDTPADVLPAKTGWAILIGFLVIMALVVAYFMFQNE